MNDKYLTVAALNRYLKAKFDNDENLKLIYLKGEISNFKDHSSGHLYFSIKDETSKINAIMFARDASKLTFTPTDGTKVLIKGRISVYEATGSYQVYVEDMQEDGIGNLYVAFEKLKAELAKEGLFNSEHKRPIPKYPSKIGIITAPTGAAIKDIISTIRRRYPLAETILFPSLVQGNDAKDDIVHNVELANTYDDIDVLIVGRGGGSIEDLWPFNEEIVARAIYNSRIPIISAVGHEIDFTIADFVADLRAPTPTGAAEMAVPNLSDVKHNLEQLSIRLNEAMLKKINYNKLYLDSVKASFVIKNPLMMFDNRKQQLDIYTDNINKIMALKLNAEHIRLNHIISQLELINPLNVFKRGYALVYKESKPITSVKDLNVADQLKIRVIDGLVTTTIDQIEGETNGKEN